MKNEKPNQATHLSPPVPDWLSKLSENRYARILLVPAALIMPLLTGCSQVEASPLPQDTSRPPSTSPASTQVLEFLSTLTPTRILSPSATATEAATPSPTTTTTATETTTPTEVPASAYAERLGLNPDRTYSIQPIDGKDYLVDDYNGAKRAVLDQADWRLLDPAVSHDLDLIYGHFIKPESVIPYTRLSNLSGDEFHPNNPRYLNIEINPHFTGEVEQVEWFFEHANRIIIDYRLELVFPDATGQTRRVFVSLGSPDLPGLTTLRRRDVNRSGDILQSGGWFDTPASLLKNLKPGDRMYVSFVYNWPESSLPKQPCIELVNGRACVDDYIKNYYLYREQSELIRQFGEAVKNGDALVGFEDIVLPPNLLGVYRGPFDK